MGKVKKFNQGTIKKITGGKDPVKIVEEFVLRRGFDPDEVKQDATAESHRWMLRLSGSEELEVLVEGLKRPSETTIYMGVNVVIVPVRGANDLLATALEIADGLVGIKVSLVGHYLVLSATLGAAGVSVEELDYHYKLIAAQQSWFREELANELGWETVIDES